ncbi:MAG: inorganic triphosphatase [Sphingomonas bacterium]|nr:inorganic triphosphatase [Sphingomonas bacterium]
MTLLPGSDEIELKLDVDPGSLPALEALPLLAGVAARSRQQSSTYFDTPAQALRGAGLSLRIRETGGRRVQTIKVDAGAAAGLFARREWECDVAGDAPDLGGANEALSALIPGKAPLDLRPAFVTEVNRTIWDVTLEGSRVELVLDEGRIACGDRIATISEIELELAEGKPAALFAIARAIAAHLPVRAGVLTKSERGYLLLDNRQARAAKAEPVRLTDDLRAADAFQAIVRSCLRQYRLNETLLLATRAPEPLHQARVALRRLRSALSLFKPLVEDDRFEHFRGELRTLAAVLGEGRNIDVLVERLGDGPLGDRLRTAREEVYDRIADVLARPATRMLVLDLSEWSALGGWREAEETAPLRRRSAEKFGRDLLDRYRKRIRRRGKRIDRIDDEGRHEVRILAKKLRYAAEFFSDLYNEKPAPRRRKAFLAAIEQLQTALGNLNDQATGQGVLETLGLSPDESAKLLGERVDRAAMLAQAVDAYDELMDVKRFWR